MKGVLKKIKKAEVDKPITGQVSVSIARKYTTSVRYENLDVFINVTSDVEPGESQKSAVYRVYDQLRIDAVDIFGDIRDLCKSKDL